MAAFPELGAAGWWLHVTGLELGSGMVGRSIRLQLLAALSVVGAEARGDS